MYSWRWKVLHKCHIHFSLCTHLHKHPCSCSKVTYVLCICPSIAGCHEEHKHCTLEQKMLWPLSLPSGMWSIATIEVALVQQQLMVASYSSHDKEKRQCCLVCIVLNLGVSKLSSYHCSNFICCTPCIGFVFVLNWLSRECLCRLHGN